MIYLLHSDVRLGGPGRAGAQHYLGWSTPREWRYRIAEHQHGTARCAITAAFHRAGATLTLVYVRWEGGPAEERYLKANGHVSEWCSLCHPEIVRLELPGEWYLNPIGLTVPVAPSPKPESENGGDSLAGSPIGKRGWSPQGRHRASTTGSAWPRRNPSSSGGTASPAPVQQQPKEGM